MPPKKQPSPKFNLTLDAAFQTLIDSVWKTASPELKDKHKVYASRYRKGISISDKAKETVLRDFGFESQGEVKWKAPRV